MSCANIAIVICSMNLVPLTTSCDRSLDRARNLGVERAESVRDRIALVIGIGAYDQRIGILPNPRNDSDSMAKRLRVIGFDVVHQDDVKLEEFRDLVEDFGARSEQAEVALFFFAGHGVQFRDRNYLVPVDIKPRGDEENLKLDEVTVDLQGVMDGMRAQRNLVFLDACRTPPENLVPPAPRTRSSQRSQGLARVERPQDRDMWIGYAAAPGTVAEDGKAGGNSPFTAALQQRIGSPGVDVSIMFRAVVRDVKLETTGRQEPWLRSSIAREGAFMLVPGIQGGDLDRAARAWQAVKGSKSRAVLETFIDKFRDIPDASIYVELAREAVDALLLQPGYRFRDCDPPDCPLVVVVPEGAYRRVSAEGGSISDESLEVNIPYRLAVGVYEVTFEEWDACVEAKGCITMPRDWGLGRGKRPVRGVRWSDAVQYVKWLGTRTGEQYRLLSEAEWEYVARAGTESPYWWGNSMEAERANHLNSGTEYERRTRPVGSYVANPWGLHDLPGSVWEWVQDCWTDGHVGRHARAREMPGCNERVLRGGSWRTEEAFLDSAFRTSELPETRADDVGFRVVRQVER